MFNKVYLVGVGLINGSLAKDLKHKNLAKLIVGIGRDEQRLEKAKSLSIIDEYQLLQEAQVEDADLVVLGVPVGKIKHALEQIKSSLASYTIITDVGSTKGNVIEDAIEVFGQLPKNFIPAHPIAGGERSGFEHARNDLFKDHKIVLTPTHETEEEALQKIKKMWQSIGAQVEMMTAQKHDAILSATSHLPHIVAYNLVNYLGQRSDAIDIFNYAAGGFYDFTRIASSDPTMWADICIANKEKLLQSIEGFTESLKTLQEIIEKQDRSEIHAVFEQAKNLRDENLLKK